MNRYSDEDGYAQRAPARFDRVLFTGDVYGCVYLVGRRKQFQAGSSFYLSDHFAVMALVDLHEIYAGSGISILALRRRRDILGRLRDQAALLERECLGLRAELEEAERRRSLEELGQLREDALRALVYGF